MSLPKRERDFVSIFGYEFEVSRVSKMKEILRWWLAATYILVTEG